MFSAAYTESEPTIVVNESHMVVNRRSSVSAECDHHDSASLVERNLKVPDSALSALSKIFLFQGLSSASLVQVARALIPRTAQEGESIVVQGDEGDYFYIIESGSVNYEIDGENVGSSGPGSSFGELALMYNSPRAATVVAASKCSLWALDRTSFKNIMVKARSEKRKQSLRVLESVELFNSLDQASKLRIADALQSEIYEKGAEIVHEGDIGSFFYLISDGDAVVTSGGKELAKLGRGDYFGELALLDNTPRAATVTATTELKLKYLNKDGFERMLGPEVMAELRRCDPRKHSSPE